MRQRAHDRPSRLRRLLITSMIVAGLLFMNNARADDLSSISSLKLVPADAAFYSTSLRLREQFDAVMKSKALAKLQALPAVKMFHKQLHDELFKPEGPGNEIKKMLEDPQNQQLLDLLKDMCSTEVFLYGGDSCAAFTNLAMGMANSMNYGPAMMQLSGGTGDLNQTQIQVAAMLRSLSSNLDQIKIPDIVFGFKLSQAELAGPQLKRLETVLKGAMDQNPQLKGRLKNETVAGSSFLTIQLDGKMIPFDPDALKQFEAKPGEYDALVNKVKSLTFTVALGVRDQYLLLSIGGSTAPVAKLGKGKSVAELPELKPLETAKDKKLTDINYVSKAMTSSIATTKKDLNSLKDVALDYLKKANLPADLQKRAQKDMSDLIKDLQVYIPDPGAVMSFSYLTDRGAETYTYDWTEQLSSDASKPLTLLDHVGGSPILAVVGRSKYSPENYDRLVKWIKVLDKYYEEFAAPQLDGAIKDSVEQIRKLAVPVLQRIDAATGKMLLPSLKDGQSGFVLDAKWSSKQWAMGFPGTAQPMPMLEIGLIYGVSDAALLKKAFTEYLSILNDTIAIANNQTGGLFPDLKIPDPQTRDLKAGTLYFYPIPPLIPLDPQILPNAGLSNNVLVLSLSEKHSQRMLTKTPLKVDGLLSKTNRPMSAAVYFNWAGMVDAITPWVDYAIKAHIKSRGEGDEAQADEIFKQVKVGLEVLKVFRSVSSISYLEGKVAVTRTETVIHDID